MRPKARYKFYELEDGSLLETFKRDVDQEHFDFVLKYPLDAVAEKVFDFEAGAFFGKEAFGGDLIQELHLIKMNTTKTRAFPKKPSIRRRRLLLNLQKRFTCIMQTNRCSI